MDRQTNVDIMLYCPQQKYKIIQTYINIELFVSSVKTQLIIVKITKFHVYLQNSKTTHIYAAKRMISYLDRTYNNLRKVLPCIPRDLRSITLTTATAEVMQRNVY